MARWAIDDGKPVLGVCRGMQIINLAAGGTLYQDIAEQMAGSIKHDYFPFGGSNLRRDFLAHEVCVPWERAGQQAAALGIRTVIFRSGVVIHGGGSKSLPIDLRGASLSRPGVILKTEEGAFPLLVMPFYFFTGGPILPGTQWFA